MSPGSISQETPEREFSVKREPKAKLWVLMKEQWGTSSRGGNAEYGMGWLKGRKMYVQGRSWWELPRLVSGSSSLSDGTAVPFTSTNIY